MPPTSPPLTVHTWGDSGPRVVLVHGSNQADPERVWGGQRVLAERYRVVVPIRRGYDAGAPVPKPLFEADVRDLVELLGDGAHLVGFSYGGVVSLLAAERRPDLVRSLTLVEPPAFAVASGDPEVEALIDRMTPLWAPGRDPSPEQWIAGFARSIGDEVREPVELPPANRAAVLQTMHEPPPWLAEPDLEGVAAAPFPKLVVSGGWKPWMQTVCDVLTERLSAERLHVPGVGHAVQHAAPEPFNARLAALVDASDIP